MYNAYFGFREKPFNATPDPHFFYSNPTYQKAYDRLLYGIHERKGFLVLTGEVGTGKTTLLHRLMNNLDAAVRSVFFHNTTLTFQELLSFICQDLGLTVTQEGRLQKIQALNDFLLARLREGGTTALLIDEAQHLGDGLLENLRLLSNLETGGEKLLQIVLAGQPELETTLAQPQLRQFKQRISVQCQLDRLRDQEVGLFIHHRLRMAGFANRELFTSEAIQYIGAFSKGIPRLINIICDNALHHAYNTAQKTVSTKTIEEVAQNLKLTEDTPPIRVDKAPRATNKYLPQQQSRRLVMGDGALGKALQELKNKVAQHRSIHLAWVGGTCLLFLLGLFWFVLPLSRKLDPAGSQGNPWSASLVEPDVQSQSQGFPYQERQYPTLIKRAEPAFPARGRDSSRKPSPKRGKATLETIAKKYTKVQPTVWGLATAKPEVALFIPETEWVKLSPEDQVSLALYVESLVPLLRANPDRYLKAFHNEPDYDTLYAKVTSLCDTCWVIGTGRPTLDEEGVLFDKVVVQGDDAW